MIGITAAVLMLALQDPAPTPTTIPPGYADLIASGLTCWATLDGDGEPVFLNDGDLALIGIDGRVIRLHDQDATIGLPEDMRGVMDGKGVRVQILPTGAEAASGEEGFSGPAELTIEIDGRTSRNAVTFGCGA